MSRLNNLLVLAFLLAASVAGAQPTVTGLEDKAFNDGVTFLIGGSSFGAGAVQTHWDDLSDSAYSGLSSGDVVPTISGAYGHPTDVNAPWYKMDSSYPNSSVVYEDSPTKVRVNGKPVYSIVGGRGYIVGINMLSSPTMFIDWWYYSATANAYPENSSGDPQGYVQTKIIRIWPDPAKSYGHASFYPGKLSYDLGPTSDEKAGPRASFYPTDGEWRHLSVWTDGSMGLSYGGSSGILKAWSNNVLTFNVSNQGLRESSSGSRAGSGTYSYVGILGQDPIDRSGHIGQNTFFSDIYVSTTQARVIVADASTWSAVRHYEIQPIISWGSTSIQITVNTGSFNTGDNAWVYVVNSSGVQSNGALIPIGSSGGGIEANPLAPPTDLTADGGN